MLRRYDDAQKGNSQLQKNRGAALPNKQEMMLTVTDDSRADFKSLALSIPAAKTNRKTSRR